MAEVRLTRYFGRRFRFLLLPLLLALVALGMTPTAQAAEGDAGPVYIKLDSMEFSVIGDGGRVSVKVSLQLSLELKPGVLDVDVRPYQPKIQDRILPILYDLWANEPPNGVTVEQIKKALMPAIVDVTGQNKIDQILVQGLGEIR